jgi:hypothetical protein
LFFFSYKLNSFSYKLNSGKPQGVLNFSYKFDEVTQSTTVGYVAPNSSSATYAQSPSGTAYPPASAYPPTGKADVYPPPPAAKIDEHLQTITSSTGIAQQWVSQHVQPFMSAHLVNFLATSIPPLSRVFREGLAVYIMWMLDFHSQTGSPLLINPYPFFVYKADPGSVSLSYVLFKPNPGVRKPEPRGAELLDNEDGGLPRNGVTAGRRRSPPPGQRCGRAARGPPRGVGGVGRTTQHRSGGLDEEAVLLGGRGGGRV